MVQPKVKKAVKKYVPTAKEKKNIKDATEMKNMRPVFKAGGKTPKAKDGKSFPDLNKDGKVTKADILKGRGVIAKKGTSVKKYQMGGFVSNEFASKSQKFPAKTKPTSNAKLLDSSIKKGKAINAYQGKKGMLAKSGTTMKKCRYGCK